MYLPFVQWWQCVNLPALTAPSLQKRIKLQQGNLLGCAMIFGCSVAKEDVRSVRFRRKCTLKLSICVCLLGVILSRRKDEWSYSRGQVVDGFWLCNSVQVAWWQCQVPGFLSTFFYKMLILVHNLTDFSLLGCTSQQLRLRYSSTYTNVEEWGMEGIKYFIPLKQ